MLDLQSYLRGKGRNVPLKKGRLDLTSYLLGKAASGGIQEITGTLPLYVRSRASQILKNYIIYGESVQDGTPTPEEPVEVTGLGIRTDNLFNKNAKDPDNGYVHNARLDSNGSIFTTGNTNVSEYISISPGKQYIFRYGGGYSNAYNACIYDEQKNFVRSIGYNNVVTKSFTANEGERFFRMTWFVSYKYPNSR